MSAGQDTQRLAVAGVPDDIARRLSTLVTVAGRRRTVEENFQAGKGLC